jgi:hypothetical protein
MPEVTLHHFLRAAADIGVRGDNDTLPFDLDTRFVKAKQDELASAAFAFWNQLKNDGPTNSDKKVDALTVFHERLLTPAGSSGFRITTKIHPFWSVYLNGLAIAVAEAIEGDRDPGARSYRYDRASEHELFDRTASWRRFREDSLNLVAQDELVVVQTDVSSFYEHISHHYLQNALNDVFPDGRLGNQVNALLGKFSSGRSFGLPVGGQASRIFAELFMNAIDHELTSSGLKWLRYVDDYLLVANSAEDAYRALSTLSYALGNYGLSLNKTKTVILTAKHYRDFVSAQLGGAGENAARLVAIDLHFDPYSDTALEDYESLKDTVAGLEVQTILNQELDKGLPDNFLVSQITRTLRLQAPKEAISLVATLLEPKNLNSFRGSWAAVMRGVYAVRMDPGFDEIHSSIDWYLDRIPEQCPHLLQAEGAILHYLRTLYGGHTKSRAVYVRKVFDSTRSETVKRACIECWRRWSDRPAFNAIRNNWSSMTSECQRSLWLASYSFGDQGEAARRQLSSNMATSLRLGIETQTQKDTFAKAFLQWCEDEKDPA